jgi:hypothetical protein
MIMYVNYLGCSFSGILPHNRRGAAVQCIMTCERRVLEGDVENCEKQIDELVFRLYGVNGLPC